jgi:hypothetical protein
VKIPGAERSVVEPAKVRDYLLSPSHPVGRFKAQFFVGLGYAQESWAVLAADIRRHAVDGVAQEGDASPYGRKFEVRGTLVGPSGRGSTVISVWIILHGADSPRFITAFPG